MKRNIQMFGLKYKICLLTFSLLFITIEYSFSQTNDSDDMSGNEGTHINDINIGLLIRSGGDFSITGERFNGNRAFQFDAARVHITGDEDDKVFYRLDLGIGSEVDFFEAYAGYSFWERFQFKAGVMRPFISRDFEMDIGNLEVINRARYSKVMLNPRETGLTMSINSRYLNGEFGVYNGNGQLFENDNFFYYAGRLSTLLNIRNTEIQFGGVGSLNMTRDLTVGNSELISSGFLYVFGGFFELSSPAVLFRSEFLQSRFDVQNLGGSEEIINGLYASLGVQLTSRNQFLIRVDYLDYSVLNQTTELATIGWNLEVTDKIKLMINFLAQFDSDWEEVYGVSLRSQFRL